MEGSLEKLTNNKLGLNYYQKRHFRLEWSQLKYYARADDDAEKGAISLAEMHGAYLSDDDAQRKTIVLLFGNRSLFLLAPDPEEAAAWVHNLRSYTKRSSASDPIPMPRHIARSILVLIASCRKHGGAQQEGLFRVPGRASEIKSICRSVYLNRSTILTPAEACDVESTAGAIKRLLWSLPEPLFTKAGVEPMIRAQDAAAIRQLVLGMPADNQVVIGQLFGLMRDVCDNTATTKMTPSSLAMCFAPCLSGAESGAIHDMKTLFSIAIGSYADVFSDIAPVLDADDALGATTIVDCVPKTSSARAITAVLAEHGGDIQATLKRKSIWGSIRPRAVAAAAGLKSVATKPRPSMPDFEETRSKPASVATSLALGSMMITPAAVADDERPVPPKIQQQLDHLRNRVHELEERCAYWRNKAEAAEAALNAVQTETVLPRKSLMKSTTTSPNLVVRTPKPLKPTVARMTPAADTGGNQKAAAAAADDDDDDDDEISSEDGHETDDTAGYRTAMPEIPSTDEPKTDEEISDLSDDEPISETAAVLAQAKVA